MAIIKICKQDHPFLIINQKCVQDSRLSWQARGMLIYLLSLPRDWEVIIADLINRAPSGRDAVYANLKELKEYGYIQHIRPRDSSGRLSKAEYMVFDTPVDSTPHTDNPDMDKPHQVSPDQVKRDRVKPPLYNKQYTNKQITKQTSAAAENDEIISEELTQNQLLKISQELDRLANYSNLYPDKNLLKEQVINTILSPQFYTKTGSAFNYKLNTILKAIRTGNFSFSSENVVVAKENTHTNISELDSKLQQAEQELMICRDDLERFHSEFRDETDLPMKDYYQTMIAHHQKLNDLLEKRISELKKGHDVTIQKVILKNGEMQCAEEKNEENNNE